MGKKKNILIIGASSEIAQAVIKKLDATNYTILTTMRSGGNSTYTLDLADDNSISEFETTIDGTPLYCVLYCAGFITPAEQTQLFSSEYSKMSERINFTAAVRLLNRLTANIQDGGVVAGLSSTAGIWGSPQFPIYSSWKGALNTFLQSLHKQQKEKGKHIFSVCPGPTNTQMRQSLAGDAEKHQSPDVVAKFVVEIIENPTMFAHAPILVIREMNLYTLDLELTQIS